MPSIKKLKVSFDLDMEVFAKILALGHSDMHIEAYAPAVGEEPCVTHTAQITHRGGMQTAILNALRHKGKVKTSELNSVLEAQGYSVKSLAGVIYTLKGKGLIRSGGYGLFVITKKGLAHVGA